MMPKLSLLATRLVKGGTRVSLERSRVKCKMESGKVCFSFAFFGVYSLLTFLLHLQLFNVGSGLTDIENMSVQT